MKRAPTPETDWSILYAWGGTPEIIHEFIKGQQTRIHHAQNVENELAFAIAERDNALSDWRQADTDSIRALHERNEARQQRDELAKALDVTLNATVLNHRNDRWHIDAEHLLYRIRLLMQPPNQNE